MNAAGAPGDARPLAGLFGFRLATRLARREVLRRPGRTVLVALLVALPVAGMTVGAVLLRTQHETPLQQWQQYQGHADAILTTMSSPTPGDQAAIARLPDARIVSGSVYLDARLLRTVDARRSLPTIAILAMNDPATRGIVQITSGRAPAKAGEVFLTRTAARQLGVAAGGTLRLVRPARRSLHVTGVGEMAASWGETEMILPPGVPHPWPMAVTGPQAVQLLINFAHRPSAAEVQRLLSDPKLRATGFQLSPTFGPRPFDVSQQVVEKRVRWSWVIGALVLTVVGIVIASAFAAGARRQLVTLGQLAANGAAPKVLRRVLFLQGTLAGIVGAIGGVGLAAVALVFLAPHADSLFRRDVHPYIVHLGDIVPILLLGVATATIAALVPARTAGRVPVLAALAGRRPLGRVPRWLPIAGGLAVAGGLGLFGLAVLGAGGNPAHRQVWAFTAIAGGMAVLLGACAVAPLYVSVLEPAAARVGGSLRVAARSLARQRTRTSAVVSAIAATGALVIGASSLVLAFHDRNAHQARFMRSDEVQLTGLTQAGGISPPPAAFTADIEKVLPHSTRFQLRSPARPGVSWEIVRAVPKHPADALKPVQVETGSGFVFATGAGAGTTVDMGLAVGIADDALIANYGLTNADRSALEHTGALVLANTSGHATLAAVTHVAAGLTPPAPQRFGAAMVDGGRYVIGNLPSVLMTPARAAALGMPIRTSTLVLRSPKALTTDQRNTITDIATSAREDVSQQAAGAINADFYAPPGGIDPLLVEWVLVGVALLLTLFVVAVNLALSATETRDERDVLTVVGAAPGAMSRTNGYKATTLTVMGALLAIPIGLSPVAVFVSEDGSHLPFVFPVRVVVLLVLALPLLAGLVTAAASALALRVRPVHISTMAFD